MIIRASITYFALVFVAGFVMGIVRIYFLVPRLEPRVAELIEMPLMLVVIILAARFIVKRFTLPSSFAVRFLIGAIALLLLLVAELAIAWSIMRESPIEYIVGRDKVSGGVYLAMLGLLAFMPAILKGFQAVPLPASAPPTIKPADEAKIAASAGETARHYGTMRFAMFTVFTGITGALLAFAFSDNGVKFLAQQHQKYLLCVGGLLLSTLFALAEFRISYLVTFYQESAYGLGVLAEPDEHKNWKVIVLWTMLIPYIFSAIFWLLLLASIIKVGPK